jgi:ribosome biogenesis GTPase A
LITRKASAKISKQAGFTKGMQKIRFTDNILILDTPGVIPDKVYSNKEDRVATDAIVGARTFSDVKTLKMLSIRSCKLIQKSLKSFMR